MTTSMTRWVGAAIIVGILGGAVAMTSAVAGSSAVQIVRFEVRAVHSVDVTAVPLKLTTTETGHEGSARVRIGSHARITASVDGDAARPVELTVAGEDATLAAHRALGLSQHAAAVGAGPLAPGAYRFGYKVPGKGAGTAKIVLTVIE